MPFFLDEAAFGAGAVDDVFGRIFSFFCVAAVFFGLGGTFFCVAGVFFGGGGGGSKSSVVQKYNMHHTHAWVNTNHKPSSGSSAAGSAPL